MIFAYLFTVLNTNDSKLPNARGLPNVIILPLRITSLCILNIPAFIQTRKKTPHSNRWKKWEDRLVQDQSALRLSADEKSPCDARPHSSWCSLSCSSWLQPRPSILSSVALGLKFYKLYFFLVHWLHFSFCQFTPGRGKELEKEMATHSSILAWRIPWMEEPGGLQPTGSQ